MLRVCVTKLSRSPILEVVQGSMRRVLFGGAAVCAVAAVGGALAANSGSFTDRTGDAQPAPDLSAVAISNDDAGNVTVRVTVDRAALGTNDEVMVGIDADQNPDTGSVLYGAEFGLDLTGGRPAFLRPGPGGYLDEASGTFTATMAGGVVTFTFKASDVGLTPTSGFDVFVLGYAQGGADTAPDIRTVNYQMVAGTPRPQLGPDTRGPLDEAVKSTGTRGKTARLSYFSAEGRGVTAETIRVFKGKKVLKTFKFKLADTNPFFGYYASWKVPKKVKGKLRFCVQSVDRAGNKSNTSCAALTIK
jgi:hypothetical protein